MASISSVSKHNNDAHIEASNSPASASTARSAALPAAHSQEELANVARLRSRPTFHRDLNLAVSGHEHAPRYQHGFKLRSQSLANLAHLFKGADDMSPIGRAQDQKLANEMFNISSVALPATMKSNDGVVVPPDLMAYWVRHEGEAVLRYACPEINGTGFGGIATMPPEQFRTMMNTHGATARQILADANRQGEQPLMLVANSGREGAVRSGGVYPDSANSKMIWEKAHIADHYARQWGSTTQENHPESLDSIITPYYRAIDAAREQFGEGSAQYLAAEKKAHASACDAMATTRDKPLVLLGYSCDVAAVCRIEDGRATLFGRPVNALLNDRAAENLNMVQKSKLDFTKMALINSTVDESVNKFFAAKARAEFASSPQAAALPALAAERGFVYDVKGLDKAFHYTDPNQRGDTEGMSPLQRKAHHSTFFRGVEEHEGMEGIKKAFHDFKALGDDIRPLFKPNGTGQSKGIIGVRHDDTWETFEARFKANRDALHKDFGAAAGWPYHVEVLVELDQTPEHENYDLRFTIMQSRQPQLDEHNRLNRKPAPTMHAFPLMLKKEAAPEQPRTGPVEFAATNVTASVAGTGRPASDFVLPLCSKKTMEEAGMDENLAKSMSLYFSSLYAFIISSHYARPAEAKAPGGEAKVLAFPLRGAGQSPAADSRSSVTGDNASATLTGAKEGAAAGALRRFG